MSNNVDELVNNVNSPYYNQIKHDDKGRFLIWDRKAGKYIPIPSRLKTFYNELIELYKKYDLSISNEDCYGAFIIEEYKKDNVVWIMQANLDSLGIYDPVLPEDLSWLNEI